MEDIEMFEGAVYLVFCQCENRYPQVDAYNSDVNNNSSLVLECDECNARGAEDI